jgi:hypothetical protein
MCFPFFVSRRRNSLEIENNSKEYSLNKYLLSSYFIICTDIGPEGTSNKFSRVTKIIS